LKIVLELQVNAACTLEFSPENLSNIPGHLAKSPGEWQEKSLLHLR